MKIPLQGKSKKFAIIDDEDFGIVSWYKWYLHSSGYAVRTYMKDRKNYAVYMHREILDIEGNIDHINGNPLDNRKSNLRACNQTQNNGNRKISANNTSGYKGVFWHKKAEKWMAQIGHDNKQHYLGLFDTQVEAAKAYNAKAMELFGDFSLLNEVQ